MLNFNLKVFGAVLSLALSAAGTLLAQPAVAPVGGRGGEEPDRAPVLNNRPPVLIRPEPPEQEDAPVFSDHLGRLEVIIDPNHGYLKSVRFPALFDAASAGSIDRYVVLEGPAATELDDEVIDFQSRVDATVPHVVVDCLNRTSGIAVRKIYQFDPVNYEVTKTVEIDSPSDKLMTIVSVSVLSDEARKGGYYYQYLTHTASRYVSFPTERIGEAYFLNQRNFQSGVMTVTRPDIDFTYGEVQLRTNDMPEYMCVQSDGWLPLTANIETLLIRDGWQMPRGSWVKVGPGRGPQRISWLFSATKGTHLMWHANYHKRYFFPAFAPERRIDKAMDLAFDTSFLWPHSVMNYKDGKLEPIEGDPDLWFGGLNKRWADEPLHYLDKDGKPKWRQNLLTFDAVHTMFERLDLDPRSWATLGLAETMYTMGDFFADHMWFSPGVPHTADEVFYESKKVPMKEYFRFVRMLGQRWPKFKLFNYERGGYYPHGQTIHQNPHFAFYPIPDGTMKPGHAFAPWYNYYFEQMTDKYRQLQREGVSLYVDWGLPASHAGELEDGRIVFQEYKTGQAAVRKMARAMRDAGGFFYVNQPSGPWADFGYIEGGSWDTDTRTDWRFWAERLNLYKLHEFRPNTVVALDMMCDEFIHQCLIYNLVPSTMNRVGVATKQSWAPQELIRLRWYLREASMAPVPLRPVAWETPGSPLETSVMTLPGTVYLGAYNHVMEDHTADLSADLAPVIANKPYAVWRADVTKGPWAGLTTEQGCEPHIRDVPDGCHVGYKYEKAEVAFAPYKGFVWDGRHLTLPTVKIPGRQTSFFFLSTVPALVRSVEGREIPWPLGSQPHLHVHPHPDGSLLIESDYTEAVLAMHPGWLDDDAAVGAPDGKTGWPTVTVRPGSWRLKPDGRMLYESRRNPPPSPDDEFAAAAPPPLTTGGPTGVHRLGIQKKIILQNGLDGYAGQSNEQMTTGQWGSDLGHYSHGGVNGTDVIFIYRDSDAARHAHNLIRFDLEKQVPQGANVVRATLVIDCYSGINGSTVLTGHKALKPWTDGRTFWKNWGNGGNEAGYAEDIAVLESTISSTREYHFRLDPSVVQGWLDDPDANYGLLLKPNRDSNAFHWSAQGDTGDIPPKLVIEYDEG